MVLLGRSSGVSHVVSGGGARGTAPLRAMRATRALDLKLRDSFTPAHTVAGFTTVTTTSAAAASTLRFHHRNGLFGRFRTTPVQAVFQHRASLSLLGTRAFSFSTSKKPAMASAASFYEFKPKDSTCFPLFPISSPLHPSPSPSLHVT